MVTANGFDFKSAFTRMTGFLNKDSNYVHGELH